MNKKQYLDITERVVWTFIEGGVSVISINALGLPTWAIPPVAAALAIIKNFAATKVGKQGTPSTLPAASDPSTVTSPVTV